MAEFDDKYIDPSKRLECRYYEPQYPEIEELVMVNVVDATTNEEL